MAVTQLPSTSEQRPVDIEIVARPHAILSASSAERWLTCTPSARIEEGIEDEESRYATDGTAAHAFSEMRLRFLLRQINKTTFESTYKATKALYAEVVDKWDPLDWASINVYVDYVMDEAKRLDAEVFIEERVDYSKYAEGGFGTSDALLVSGNGETIKSIDLKFGKGVMVSAWDNPQAKLYALGGLLKLSPERRRKVKNIEWSIVQPRLDHIGEDSCTAEEMHDWAENTVRPAAKLAWAGEGKLNPSEKACRFCKARATCRARTAKNVLIARRDFGLMNPDPNLMEMDEIARILPELSEWMQWARDLEAYALEQARDKHVAIPGYKVVRGRANRKWSVEDEATLAKALKALDVPEEIIFEPVKNPVRSVAQVEKLMGKKPFAEHVAGLVVTPLGTPALVPSTDPRPAIDREAEARNAFRINGPEDAA